MPEHRTLPNSELHEPKDISSATSGQVYISDGAGSGTWTTLTTDRAIALTIKFEDANTASELYVPVPMAGTISRISLAQPDAPHSGFTTTFTAKINGLTVTDGDVAFTSALAVGAGDVQSTIPSANNVVVLGDSVEIECSGNAGAGTMPVVLTIFITE